MKCTEQTMRLYAVTDRSWLNDRTLAMQVDRALKGGATCIQLREKNLDDESFYNEAMSIKTLCKKYFVPLIINDNVNVAIRCGADGIHVGQEDVTAQSVREKIGDKMILGVSAHNVEQALEAEKNGADYLGAGAVFSTSTKADANTITHKALREICSAVSIPVVAIGGINKSNIHELGGTGVSGVALISAIFASNDIENECKTLLKLSENMFGSDVRL